MNVFKFPYFIWIYRSLWFFQYSTIVDIYAFNNFFICATTMMTTGLYAGPFKSNLKKFSNNHLSESKGARKGKHKAKVRHRHGVDFSMGYWTKISMILDTVIKLHFLFCTQSVTAAIIISPWFCDTSLHCFVTVALWKTAFMFYFMQGLKRPTYMLSAYMQYTVFIWARAVVCLEGCFQSLFLFVLLDCAP